MDPPVSREPATTDAQPAQPATHDRERLLRRRLDELVGAVEPKLSRGQRKAKAQAAGRASRAIAEDYAQQPPGRPVAAAADTTLAAGTSSSSQPALPPPSVPLALSDTDVALLRHDFASDVSLFDLDSLDPVQLAVAALRPDLDSLVQRRAYHEFLLRRDEYEQGFGADIPEPIFSVPLNFLIPTDVSTLDPTSLLLVQFNPLCLSGDEATAAGTRFFELARQARAGTAAELPPALLAPAARRPIDTALELAAPVLAPSVERAGADSAVLAEVAIDRCVVSCRGVGSTPSASLVLRVEQDGLAVASGAGKHLFAIEPAKVREFAYYPSVPAEGNDLTASAPTIVLDLKRVLVPAGMPWNGKKTTVRLESAQLCEPDAGFEILRTRIRAWAEEFGFEAWSSRDHPPDDATVTARTAAGAGAAAAPDTSGTPAPTADLEMADLTPPPRPADSIPPAAPAPSTSTPTALPPAVALPPAAAAAEPAPASTSTLPHSTSSSRAFSSYVELPVKQCVVVHKSGRQDVLEGPLVVRVQAHGLVVLPPAGFMLQLEAAQMDEVDYISPPTLDGRPSRSTMAVSLAELATSALITHRSVVVRLDVDRARDPTAWYKLCEAVMQWAGEFGFETRETIRDPSERLAAPALVETPSADLDMADLAPPPLPAAADPRPPISSHNSTSAPVPISPSRSPGSTSPDWASTSSSADPSPITRPSLSLSNTDYFKLAVERCVVVHKDGQQDALEGPLVLREAAGALVVVPQEGSVLRLEAAQMDEVDYIDQPAPDDSPPLMTVAFSLAELSTSASSTHRNVVVRLEIDSARDEEAWQGLCEAVMRWAGKYGFRIKEDGYDDEDGTASPKAPAPVELPPAVLPAATEPPSRTTLPPPLPPQLRPTALPRPSPPAAGASQTPPASRLPSTLPARPPKGSSPRSPAPEDVADLRLSRVRPPPRASPFEARSRPVQSSESGTPPLPYGRRSPEPSGIGLKRSPSPPFRRDDPAPPPRRRRSPSPRRRPDPAPDRRRSRSPDRLRDPLDSPPRRLPPHAAPPPPPRRSPSPYRRSYSPPDRRRSRSPRRDSERSLPPRRERSPPRRERSPPPRRRSRSPEQPRYAPRRTPSPGRRGSEPRWGRRELEHERARERERDRSPPPRRRSGYPPSPERGHLGAGSARDDRYAASSEPKWWTR